MPGPTASTSPSTPPIPPPADTHEPSGPARLVAWTAETEPGDDFQVNRGAVYVVGRGRDGALSVLPARCRNDAGECEPQWTGAGGSLHFAGKLVFVDGRDDVLYAYRRDCRVDGAECQPLWTGVGGSLLFAGKLVLVDGDDDRLHVYGRRCRSDGGKCRPLWTGAEARFLEIHRRVVYVDGRDGYLRAYPLRCREDGEPCRPLWTGFGGSLEILGDIVYVIAPSGRVYGYPSGCRSGRHLCQPYFHTGPLDAEGDLQLLERLDLRILHVEGPELVVLITEVESYDKSPAGGRLYGLPVRCRTDGGTCWPLWKTGLFLAPTAILHEDHVVVASLDGISAYPVSCGTGNVLCRPTWWGARGLGGAIVIDRFLIEDDVVYLFSQHDSGGADGGSLTLIAYPASCAGSCQPLWRFQPPAGFGTHLLTGDHLFVSFNEETRVFSRACIEAGDDCPPIGRASEDLVFRRPRGLGGEVLIFRSKGERLTASHFPCDGGLTSCRPLWTVAGVREYGGYGPFFDREGVAYLADRFTVQAAPAECEHPDGCGPLWVYQAPDRVVAPPWIQHDLVFLKLREQLIALDPPGGGR